jgi:hypothetical protein
VKVLVLVYYPDSLTYTIARAIARGGHEVSIYSIANANNKWDLRIRKRLVSVPNVSLFEESSNFKQLVFDWLVCQLHPRFVEDGHAMLPSIPKVRNITAFSIGDKRIKYRAALRKQILELRRFPEVFLKAKKILYKDGYYPLDIYSLIKHKDVIGFDTHSIFLHDKDCNDYMFDSSWRPETNRTISIRRSKILGGIRHIFDEADNTSSPRCAGVEARKKLYWHEYTDANGGNLMPKAFVDVLTNSDFTLCPPGHYLLTHRPVEALVRGCLPILNEDELEIYDMSLQDGINCIAVKDNDWQGTVRRAMNIDEEEIKNMRRAVKEMESNYLTDDAIARRIRERIGLV